MVGRGMSNIENLAPTSTQSAGVVTKNSGEHWVNSRIQMEFSLISDIYSLFPGSRFVSAKC